MTVTLTSGAPAPAGALSERILSVRHYTDRLFSFRTTRPRTFRFRSGEFAMIGLPNAERPVFRAYSLASPAWDDKLEFYSIKVPDGPLTGPLQKVRPGDRLLLRPKTTGTLVLDALLPGKRLWMISTGTGIAPFASLIRDPETYEKFDQVILTQTCRRTAELTYGRELAQTLENDPLIGELVSGRFRHYATTTQEPSARTGRITAHIANGTLFREFGLSGFDPRHDRVMICGSIGLNRDLKKHHAGVRHARGCEQCPGGVRRRTRFRRLTTWRRARLPQKQKTNRTRQPAGTTLDGTSSAGHRRTPTRRAMT